MLTYILLQSGPSGSGIASQLILFGGIALIFYFFMLRPQQKKQKDQKSFIENVKKGDSVVTIGGLHGKVFSVENDFVIVEVDKGLKLKFDKTSISFENSKTYSKSS